MLTLTRLLPADASAKVLTTLSLTASQRTRSRHRFSADDGTALYLSLARGTLLRGQDLLSDDNGTLVRVLAQPEPVRVVTARCPFQLMRAAYHLGNRHVPLELAPDHLTFEPDPVLEALVAQLGGLTVTPALRPFEPEAGAYQRSHAAHDHAPSPTHSHG